MPLSRHGLREMLLLTLICAALGAAAAMLHWTAALPFVLAWGAGIAFFRDPPRRVPDGAGLLVSPADGVVTEISDLPDDPRVGGAATRIGIFLSVLDVHVNRSPCAGRVVSVQYEAGEFLDARHPECGARNESNTILIEPADRSGRLAVRQVAGLIARRIICAIGPGDDLRRGQRIGLIKFGSRTELIVPRNWIATVRVNVGGKVRGGSSVLLQLAAEATRHEPDEQAR